MIEERPCPRCGRRILEVLPRGPGRPRRWCSTACRRAASEEKRAAAAGAIATTYVTVHTSLDDHVRAVLGSPTACRNVLRRLLEMEAAGTLGEARWSSVEAELGRLRRPSPRPFLRW